MKADTSPERIQRDKMILSEITSGANVKSTAKIYGVSEDSVHRVRDLAKAEDMQALKNGHKNLLLTCGAMALVALREVLANPQKLKGTELAIIAGIMTQRYAEMDREMKVVPKIDWKMLDI